MKTYTLDQAEDLLIGEKGTNEKKRSEISDGIYELQH
jgi:hypothetical protein